MARLISEREYRVHGEQDESLCKDEESNCFYSDIYCSRLASPLKLVSIMQMQ